MDMINFLTSALVIITLTCIPTMTIVGVLTDPRYQNPFAILMSIIFIYIGVLTWQTLTKEK